MKNYFKAVVLFAGMILAPVLALAQSPCTITQLPYACRLDTVPECWSRHQCSQIQEGILISGSLTSPVIDGSLAATPMKVRFKCCSPDQYNQFVVVGLQGSTFIPIDTFVISSLEFDREYEVSLTGQQVAGKSVRFLSIDYSSFLIRDFVLEEQTPCSNPVQVFVDSVSRTTALLSWQPVQNEASWQYACEHQGISPTTWYECNTSQFFLENLDPSSTYDFYLRSICSQNEVGNEPIFPVVSFHTDCSENLIVPYVETFDDMQGEICWSGVSFANYHGVIGTVGAIDSLAIMPPIDADLNVSDLMLTFNYMAFGYGNSLEIGVMTDPNDAATFTAVDTFFAEANQEWYYTEVLLNGYTDTGRHIAFRTVGSLIIDNLVVQPIPPCIYPFPVSVANVTNTTADILLTPRGTENQWEIAYGPSGFDVNADGIHQIFPYSSISLTDLSPLTDYDLYVRSICGAEISAWSIRYSFKTLCGNIEQIPYSENFDTYCTDSDTCFPGCWTRILTPVPHIVSYWFDGSDSLAPISFPGALKLTDGYNGNNPIAALPRLADDINIQSLMLSFDLVYSMTDFPENRRVSVGIMNDPMDPSTFTEVQTVNAHHNEVNFSHYAGNGRYIAFRSSGFSMLVDNVMVDVAPPCDHPNNLSVDNILGTSAIIRWDSVMFGTEDYYWVCYSEAGQDQWDSVNVADYHYALSGLSPNTEYEVKVRCSCAEGFGDYAYTSFTTLCGTSSAYAFGEGVIDNPELPVAFFYGKSYSQQIFTQDELNLNGVSGDITALRFQYYLPSQGNFRESGFVRFYMATTSQSTFESDTSWIPFDSLQEVFADTLFFSETEDLRWMDVTLSTPFHYEGYGNIVVCALADETSCANAIFKTEQLNENRSILYYDEDFPAMPWSSNPEGVFNSRQRNNIQFVCCDSSLTCATPNLYLSNVIATDAELEITAGGGESEWQIQYRKEEEDFWTDYGTVYTPNVVLSGLDFMSSYIVRLRGLCGPMETSPWVATSFQTECGTIEHLPYTEDFSAFGIVYSENLLPGCWNKFTFNASFSPAYIWENALRIREGMAVLPPLSDTIDVSQLQVMLYNIHAYDGGTLEIGVMEDFNDLSTFILDTTIVLPSQANIEECIVPLSSLANLVTSEKFIVLKNATANFINIDTLILDYIPTCIRPENLSCTNVSESTATITWTEEGPATQWNVEYGPHGFTLGQGTVVVANTNPFVLTGLTGGVYYDFYVQSDCGGGDVSYWSRHPGHFTTSSCDSTNQCELMFILNDGLPQYGAGWGNTQVDLFSDGTLLRHLHLATAGPDTVFVPICDGARVACTISSSTEASVSFGEPILSVYAPNGEVLADNFWLYTFYSYQNRFDSAFTYQNVCDLPSCIPPVSFRVDSVHSHDAYLSWQSLTDVSMWLIEYKMSSDSVWSSVNANASPWMLSNLASETRYDVRIRSLCDDGEASDFREVNHFTTTCDGTIYMMISDEPTYDADYPDGMFKYSYSQQIYTASEMQGIEDISSFELLNSHYYSEYVWDIYMGHTTQNTFSSNMSFIAPESLTLVYSGTISDYDQSPNHWVTFNLDSTFHYNGVDNFVFAVYNHIGENRINAEKWKTYSTYISYSQPNYQSWSIRSFNSDSFDLTSSVFSGAMTRSISDKKNVIRFPKCCATPYGVSVQPNATDTTATVTWQPGGGESQWVLEYKLNSATEWTSVVCHQPSYLIADVVPSVQYMGRVMAVCDTASGEGSGFVDFTFSVVPAAPTAYSIVSSAGPGGTILPTGNINVMSGYDMTFDIVADTAAGYVIQDVFVDEVSQGPVPTYTFYAVDADHTIRAEFLNVGVEDFPEERLVLYPNPTNGKLRIENGELTIEGVEVYDVYGKLLQTLAVNDVVADLDVSGLPAGLYFARIRTDNGVVTKRFVKR